MSPFLEIPSSTWIASNELAFAVFDQFPVSTGHALIITRRLTPDWWACTVEEQHALMALAGDVKELLEHRFQPSGFNVGFNAGTAAGQTVPHVHVHVIPRYDGDVPDPRGGIRHVIPGRGNYLARQTTTELVTPFDGRMKLELLRCLIRNDLDRIDLLVSFVMRSGLDLIAGHLDEALARGAHVRVLTTDYLGITDPAALGFFLDRIEQAASTEPATASTAPRLAVRVFSDPSTSFHPKAYIFSNSSSRQGVAFVGSSNLSRSALERGIEWNVETRQVGALLDEFERLWADPRSVALDAPWLAAYRQRQLTRPAPPADNEAIGGVALDPEPTPTSVQREALGALEQTRAQGFAAGLVVMATGLGKTWLAAFDSTRPQFRRVLFIAHRDEILGQARDVYRRIRPSGTFGYFTGDRREADGDVVFASIQSLTRNLAAFDPTTFDYVVVDEFHHADAPTYRRVIAHFRPQFLLGLTATPERTDRADLLALCADNLVFDVGLVEGIERGLLSPFAYRAIRDVADYAEIPWRSGRFDAAELTKRLETTARAEQVLTEWRALSGRRRALGFCCSISHAEFMARSFAAQGVAAVAVHSGPGSAPRSASLDRLAAGDLEIVFTVDLFNEGVDVPAIDTVLLLRPTESPIVFLQQLGRGLRRTADKQRLDVLDLVGNHRSFLLKVKLLAALAGKPSATARQAVDHLEDTDGTLPPGCSIVVDTEVIDLFRELAARTSARGRAVELLQEWADEHDGSRPTALEMSLLLGKELPNKRPGGGWFGALAEAGLLTDTELLVHQAARDFLLDIEFGSYTKSFKLVTLLAMLDAGALRAGTPLPDVALTARWLVMRDRRLRNDLVDATREFANPASPSDQEWLGYWRKNPIKAWTSASSEGRSPWFAVVDGRFEFQLDLGDVDGDVFDTMVREIVDYRLHRYLRSKGRLDLGERRMSHVGGRTVDAEFVVETVDGQPTVVIESSGGTKGTDSARNLQYVEGLDLVLARLGSLGVRLAGAHLDTDRTKHLPIEERTLAAGAPFPIDLATARPEAVRTALLRSMSSIARSDGAGAGGGNPRRRMRLLLDGIDLTDRDLADTLAFGSGDEVAVDQLPL